MRLFLDTNVLIDFMGERPAYYPQAATLFTLCTECRCEIVVSLTYLCCHLMRQ